MIEALVFESVKVRIGSKGFVEGVCYTDIPPKSLLGVAMELAIKIGIFGLNRIILMDIHTCTFIHMSICVIRLRIKSLNI